MDQYLSTYRKDFLWPYVQKFSIHASSEIYPEEISLGNPTGNGRFSSTCEAETGSLTVSKWYSGPPDAKSQPWNRLKPTTPLLDPKLHPGKMGPAPEFEITRYDQPNAYLKKLQEKYPRLYNVLQSAPPDDMIRPVNQDRLRSTYQVDYGHMDEHFSVGYDKIVGDAGVSWPDYSNTRTNGPGRFEDVREAIYPGESEGIFREDANYRGGLKYNTRVFEDSREGATNYIGSLKDHSESPPRVFRDPREDANKKYPSKNESGRSAERESHEGHREAASVHRGESGAIKSDDGVVGGKKADSGAFIRSAEGEEGKALPAWRSEYQEVIGQTGNDIIRDKIHRHGTRSRGRSFIERIIMRCRTM